MMYASSRVLSPNIANTFMSYCKHFYEIESDLAGEWLQDEDGNFALSTTEENAEVLHVTDTGGGPVSITRPECAERACPFLVCNPVRSKCAL